MNSYEPFLQRYRNGEWRAKVFRDLLLNEIGRMDNAPVVLDIGCGSGFDGSVKIQAELARRCQQYIGVEPDGRVEMASFIDECYRTTFQDAIIPQSSADIAFCTMVLEHVREVDRFWAKLSRVLKPGGIFWGFTVDRRHLFCHMSKWMGRLGVKDWFLEKLRGSRGIERYENYPTCYLANSPRQIQRQSANLFACEFLSFSKVGQLDFYVPGVLRPIAHTIDRIQMAARLPGSLLAVRLEKRI